jgi:signal transduction histidine kinase
LLSMQKRSKEDEKPMTFGMEVADGLPQVAADSQRLNQILSNLITNSYQYTPPEGEVVVSASQVDDELQISVRDNGIGIDPENKTRVFQRFFRGNDPLVMATSGTGLGLSLSKSLVEMHHGRIWFQSTGIRGEGSVFTFTMPVYQIEG